MRKPGVRKAKGKKAATAKPASSTGGIPALPRALRLPRRKGSDLAGLALVTLSVLLVLSLASHDPNDPSLLLHSNHPESGVSNWIGPVGADLSALLFAFVGFAALLLPVFLLVAGWQRFRAAREQDEITGRGVGTLVLLMALPALLQQLAGEVSLRGGELAAGGAWGTIAFEVLESQISPIGSLLVLLALVAAGAILLVQTSLEDGFETVTAGLRERVDEASRSRELRREQQHKKDRQRRREEGLRRIAEREAQAAEKAKEEARQRVAAAFAPRSRRGGEGAASSEMPSEGQPEMQPEMSTRRPPVADFRVRRVQPGAGAGSTAPGPAGRMPAAPGASAAGSRVPPSPDLGAGRGPAAADPTTHSAANATAPSGRRAGLPQRPASAAAAGAAPAGVGPAAQSSSPRAVAGGPAGGPQSAAPGPAARAPRQARGPAPEAEADPRPLPAATVPALDQGNLELGARVGVHEPLPPLNLLRFTSEGLDYDEDHLVQQGELLRSRCAEFGVEGEVVSIHPGPVITVFEFQPAPGVKVSQVINLQDDLALALKAESVRIDRIAGRSTLGVEVPNAKRSVIRLGSLLETEDFVEAKSPLTLALGTTIGGDPYFADLAAMPHLLVAGATGAGKSVGLQSMITSILYKARREDVQFIFIDPKRVELGVYKDIPHLKAEVVVDPKKAANALQWAVVEMERRYKLLAEIHVRSIGFYNQAIRDPEVQRRLSLSDDEETCIEADDLKPLPYYVIVIDELADLMMVASSEVETAIARLAQMARAVGIHLIIATQRPSVDVLTGTIKANFPCRLAFATTSRHDSRTILDQVGAEQLLGKGDMLFNPPGTSRPVRLHGAYISEQETAGLVRWLKKKVGKPNLDPAVLKGSEKGSGPGGIDDEGDELYDEAVRVVVAEGGASASFLQRRMRVGFSRAARLIDMMEQDGILGPPQGSKPREVLVSADFFQEIDSQRME
ncbi:MAG: DNA translocase FtsK [Acidobacteriota bacterium]